MKKLVVLSAFLVFAFVGANAQSKPANVTTSNQSVEGVAPVSNDGEKPAKMEEKKECHDKNKKECHDKKYGKSKKACCSDKSKKECSDKKKMEDAPSEMKETK